MRIDELRLFSFRNFSTFHVELGPGFNLVIGKNACGKTNLLESVYLLSTGKSQRTSSIKEIIRFGESAARVEAIGSAGERRVEMALSISGASSLFRVNGVRHDRKKRESPIPTSLFSPDHLRLIKGSPEERRDLLDGILSQINPVYAHKRASYSKVLRERNAALQRVAAGKMNSEVIELFDDQLIPLGKVIVEERAAMVEELSSTASEMYGELAAGGLYIAYVSQLYPSLDIGGSFRERLKERRPAELARGVTLVGPHRDDLLISLGAHEMRAFASQGEQRTACLAIKLAEAKILERKFRVRPILILDDVMSELDEARRRALMERVLSGGQALLSSTNKEYFSQFELSRAEVIDLG